MDHHKKFEIIMGITKLTDLLAAQVPQTFNLYKKNKHAVISES